jgi:hypothetical protein
MAKLKVRGTGETVNLTDGNFIFKGGEGSIHIIDGIVYKHCIDGAMIPEAKLKELAVLTHPQIVVPFDVLLSRKKPVGYCMKAVPNDPVPLAQCLTKAYRERENVTPDHMMGLVTQAIEHYRYLHSHPGYLRVDGNELNSMVTSDHKELYEIDMNSIQTPSFRADALMQSVRDFTVQRDANKMWQWNEGSDWWSCAIITWYMFTAIHPFMGFHPDFPDAKTSMVEQMKAHVSVMHPDSEYPKGAVYHPFEDVIPGGQDGAMMQWYRAHFIDGKRPAAPTSFQSTIAFVAKVKEIIGSNNFVMTMIQDFGSPIVGHYVSKGRQVVATKDNIHVDRKPLPRPDGTFRIGFTPKHNLPVMAYLDGEQVRLQNLDNGLPIRFDGKARKLMSCEGRLYLLGLNNISEIKFTEANGVTLASASSVAQIMPTATQLYQGVAVQDMFGQCMASIFPASGHHRQVHLKELAGYRITDAKYEGNVLMVVAINKTTGENRRFIFRFASNWQDYDCRMIENITPTGLNFTVTDKKMCICITEDEKVEIFSSRRGPQDVKSVSDPAIVGDMRLCHTGDQVRFAHGSKLYQFSMK